MELLTTVVCMTPAGVGADIGCVVVAGGDIAVLSTPLPLANGRLLASEGLTAADPGTAGGLSLKNHQASSPPPASNQSILLPFFAILEQVIK
jgi:hypothetical protein